MAEVGATCRCRVGRRHMGLSGHIHLCGHHFRRDTPSEGRNLRATDKLVGYTGVICPRHRPLRSVARLGKGSIP